MQILDVILACSYLALFFQPWAAAIVGITVLLYVPLTIVITERRGAVRKRMNALVSTHTVMPSCTCNDRSLHM